MMVLLTSTLEGLLLCFMNISFSYLCLIAEKFVFVQGYGSGLHYYQGNDGMLFVIASGLRTEERYRACGI